MALFFGDRLRIWGGNSERKNVSVRFIFEYNLSEIFDPKKSLALQTIKKKCIKEFLHTTVAHQIRCLFLSRRSASQGFQLTRATQRPLLERYYSHRTRQYPPYTRSVPVGKARQQGRRRNKNKIRDERGKTDGGNVGKRVPSQLREFGVEYENVAKLGASSREI